MCQRDVAQTGFFAFQLLTDHLASLGRIDSGQRPQCPAAGFERHLGRRHGVRQRADGGGVQLHQLLDGAVLHTKSRVVQQLQQFGVRQHLPCDLVAPWVVYFRCVSSADSVDGSLHFRFGDLGCPGSRS